MSVGTLTRETRPIARAGDVAAGIRRDPVIVSIAALTALGAVLRFTRLGHQGFWFDEANTALLVHFSPGKMLGLIPQTESTPPLYYCIAWVWARIFGYSEVGLRSLSALVGTAVVPVAYGAGSKLISRRVGVFAAALAACNPLLVWYSQEARSYELLVLLSAAALLAFAYAREDPTRRRLAAWVIVSVLALATHYYAMLAIVPQALWLLATHWRRRPVLLAIAIVGACGGGLMQLALSQNSTGRATWIANSPLDKRVGQIVPQFVNGLQTPARTVIEPIALGLAVLGVLLLLFGSDRFERRRGLQVGALALSGLVIILLLVAGGLDDLLTRNVLGLWMPAAVMLAAGFAARRAAVLGTLAAVAFCITGVIGVAGVWANRDFQRPDWRGVVRILGTRPAPGVSARAILVQHYRFSLPLALYLPKLKWMPNRGAAVSELDVVSFTSPPSEGFCWWGSACNLWPSKIEHRYAFPGFHEVSIRHAYQFTVMRLVADRPTPVTWHRANRALVPANRRSYELLLQR